MRRWGFHSPYPPTMDNMDHQATDSFDPHALESEALYFPKSKDSLHKINQVEDEGREGDEYNRSCYQKQMSEEEARIRQELEVEIERDLEGEIKDEIYRLALRLHRLYQHQNHNHSEININISIKMEGATKVEINEIKNKNKKKKAPNSDHGSSRHNFRIENNNRHHHHSSGNNAHGKSKKFDWTKSLRSGPPKLCKPPVVHNINKHKHKQANGKEHPTTTFRQSTGSHKRAESRVLELTWK